GAARRYQDSSRTSGAFSNSLNSPGGPIQRPMRASAVQPDRKASTLLLASPALRTPLGSDFEDVLFLGVHDGLDRLNALGDDLLGLLLPPLDVGLARVPFLLPLC